MDVGCYLYIKLLIGVIIFVRVVYICCEKMYRLEEIIFKDSLCMFYNFVYI